MYNFNISSLLMFKIYFSTKKILYKEKILKRHEKDTTIKNGRKPVQQK